VAESIIDNIKSCQNKHVITTNPLEHLSHCFKHPFPKIEWRYISTCEIEKNIKSLKTKNSYGYEEIPVKILKLSVPFLISSLTYIRNKSLSSGVFPDS
jgi:hypothetical protein